jgi:hypothetical protein
MQANNPDQTTVIEMPEPVRRPWQQRRFQVAAAIGCAALLGAGVLITHEPEGTQKSAGMRIGSTPSIDPSGSSIAPSASPQAALPSTDPAAVVAAAPTVSSSGSLPKDRRTLRVVSARSDLTGQEELGWVADDGHPVGTSRCSRNLRFVPDMPSKEHPTTLICWRTSATKSVYTILVDLEKRPSERASVATIDRVWSSMR